MIFRCSSCLCVLFLLPILSVGADEDVSAGTGIVPDPYVFSQASNFMNAAVMKDQDVVIKKLRSEYLNQWEVIVPQLLLFSFRSGDKKAMIGPTILGLLKIPHEAFTKAVLPCLDSENKEFRSSIYHIMGHVDEIPGRSPADPDFSVYSEIIKSSPTNATQGLIRYMYSKSPQNAVLSMARICGDKTAEAELIAVLACDPKATLQALADRPEWWAHLYVAEVMSRNLQLRDPEILDVLDRDENPLVREVLERISPEQGPSR